MIQKAFRRALFGVYALFGMHSIILDYVYHSDSFSVVHA